MKTELPKSNTTISFTKNQVLSDVQTVMLSLGYDNTEIESALANVISTVEDKSNTESVVVADDTTMPHFIAGIEQRWILFSVVILTVPFCAQRQISLH